MTAAADGTVSVTIPALGAIVLKAGTTVAAPAAAGPITLTVPTAGAGLTGTGRRRR